MNCSNHIVCIDHWDPDESMYEKGYYPEGARDKRVYISPADAPAPLKPRWRYLLKQSRDRAPCQFWMEIIAYRLGRLIGVDVPPAYVGLSTVQSPDRDTYGALIEWFYGEEEFYVDGADLIRPVIPDYDDKTGHQHNLKTLLGLADPREVSQEMLKWCACVLAFDSIIGNTDRHPRNWGLILTKATNQKFLGRFSPAFDNGTSLSYERPEEHFEKFEDEAYVRRYLTRPSKARHHMRWSLEDQQNMNFFEFMRRFVGDFPETKAITAGLLEFTEDQLRLQLDPLPGIVADETAHLTPSRLDFTVKLIMKRTALLKEAISIS